MFFEYCFVFLLLISVFLFFVSTSKTTTKYPNELKVFEFKYLVVYLLAVAADWLQGSHIYALYTSYGFTKREIELLFVFGFGASMIGGTFIGIVADRFGRRLNCMVYGILYTTSCIILHSNNFYLLLLGRVLSGIGTSILFSAFESWLICEFIHSQFDLKFLPIVFAHTSLGNCVVSVLSGLTAQFCVDLYGLISPFDLSACLLVLMCASLTLLWRENYGSCQLGVRSSVKAAFRSLLECKHILWIALIQSLFEAAMYSFVLQWTPILRGLAENQHLRLPYGTIFSTFMVAASIGSSLFKIAIDKWPCISFFRYTLLISGVSLLLPILFPQNLYTTYFGFILFEITVGVFWPSMCLLRSKVIPESIRSTVMNISRIPLNILVIYILCQDFSSAAILIICVLLLAACLVIQSAIALDGS